MISRRRVIGMLAGAVPGLRAASRLARADEGPRLEPGPFAPTRASLASWQVPDWFRDAKFGIWAHWGPQSAPEFGDWYARNMYVEGHEQYRYHLDRYGHPSKFGFKDVIASWKAEEFDAARLMKLYKQAGAKYFVSLAVHHDNFDLWDSPLTRWNAVRTGPKKDVVGLFHEAARAEGLRFGLSEHLWISYKWFSVSRGHDRQGALAGVPYDGLDPRNVDLYHDCPEVYTDLPWDESGIPEAWKRTWFRRIRDLVDRHEPDLLYTDGAIPFQDWGPALVAHYYNRYARSHGGRLEAVYTAKRREDCEQGTCVFDVERGVVETIWPRPWESHTCVGNWHYKRGQDYKSAKIVIDTLVDVVSRNGNLLLNFPLTSSGVLDAAEERLLGEIGAFLAIHGEAVYGTRPWRTFGADAAPQAAAADAKFNEGRRHEYGPGDVRFTSKGELLYAFVMGWPGRQARIPALAPGGAHGVGRIREVHLLGAPGGRRFTQDAAGLTVDLPDSPPSPHALALRILGAG